MQRFACPDAIDTSSDLQSSGFGFNTSNTRNQASSITSANVAQLSLAMTHVAAGTKEKRSATAVTTQTVYFAEGRGGQAGHGLWRRFYGTFYGVNAKTGVQVWKAFMGENTSQNFITGSPQFYDGVMFVSVATKEVITTLLDVLSPCCKSHGLLQAIDPYTGKIKWTYQTAPKATYNASTRAYAPNGMSIWGTPLIDSANGSVIVGTGHNLSLPTTNNSDSLIALEIKIGSLNWSKRLGAGGSLGGIHWGMAVDSQRIYAAITDIWVNKIQRLALTDVTDFLVRSAPCPRR